jgi:hypothetical protein
MGQSRPRACKSQPAGERAARTRPEMMFGDAPNVDVGFHGQWGVNGYSQLAAASSSAALRA